MYFPTSTARRVSTVPSLPNIPPEDVISITPSPRKSLFCALTRNGVALWRVRPCANLSYLARTPISLLDHGDNQAAYWAPDGSRIVIQTNLSFLVLVSVEYDATEAVYQSFKHLTTSTAQQNFQAGPGEGFPLSSVALRFEGVIHIQGTLVNVSPRRQCIIYSTKRPASVERVPWPESATSQYDEQAPHHLRKHESWQLNERDYEWLLESEVFVADISFSRISGVEVWITSDGRVYSVALDESADGETPRPGKSWDTPQSLWKGTCIHDFVTPRWVQKQRVVDPDEPLHQRSRRVYVEPKRAVCVAVNGKFTLVAVGMLGGGLCFTSFPSEQDVIPASQDVQAPNPYNKPTGAVRIMEWSSDGYVLAVGWEHGWAVFSVGGRCLASGFGVDDSVDEERFQDLYMHGIISLFWAPGNFELFALAKPSPASNGIFPGVLTSADKVIGVDGQLFVIPFAKSASTGQLSPDNTRYAFLQLDDRALVYRGADQPDMSVINPEADVWQHVKIPQQYLAANWPVRYSTVSNDGRLIAIAGRKGLIHYSSTSGRWKLFSDEVQEQAFSVRGGLLWFHHVLIAAVEVARSYQIRLYSRDSELSNRNVLFREVLTAPVVIMSLVDNSLLVYAADNSLSHYLITPTDDSIKLHLCGSITFDGIIVSPSAVRMLSWMIPPAQKHLGDPTEDLSVATVLMVCGGQLILLRPRKPAPDRDVQYDMQIFAERIEFCWTHLRGIGALENSLWAYDGRGMRVWLNALSLEAQPSDHAVKESVNIPLEFYPLSVLMDKGIIIGAEHEAATRSNLPFVMFRHSTSSHLFLHHILLVHLAEQQIREAVAFATHYQELVYFAHALEILLHTVVESETEGDTKDEDDVADDSVLKTVVQFLDHFDASLDIVVGCARKTEVTRWRRLFNIVGNPKALFELCLESNRLKTAGSYLLVLHNLEQLDEKHEDTIRLLRTAVEGGHWQLCKDLLRFLRSIDETGHALQRALSEVNLSDGLAL